MKKLTNHHKREMKIDPDFIPCELQVEEECFRNGIFHFNISRMIEDIESGRLPVIKEQINVERWLEHHCDGVINEEHMLNVVFSKPVIQAEIRHGVFELIDGHHRIEKAHREGVSFIDSYILMGEQLPQYLTRKESYIAYVNYWNDKLKEYPY